jgi:hypothetical protein
LIPPKPGKHLCKRLHKRSSRTITRSRLKIENDD